jgi:molybdate/tungstate transport system substrate-binding protein
VIGYNPHSRFASQLKTKPWYDVITEPGIKVGRTDPKLDPKGKLTAATVGLAAHALNRPRLLSALARSPVFPEEDLVGRLEAGQLDAGFFYSVEAAAQHMPTVSLRPTHGSATYTITILKGAPNSKGAAAFLSYFLGSRGKSILSSNGLDPTPLSLTGPSSAPPAGVRALLGG